MKKWKIDNLQKTKGSVKKAKIKKCKKRRVKEKKK